MKKMIATVLVLMMLCCTAYAGEQPALEIWANFNDNQKALWSVLDEIDGEIEGVFEYLGNIELMDGSKEIVDLLFIIATEAEDGVYVLDLADGKFYNHINDKKLNELEERENLINILMNSWVCGGEFLWYDMEVQLPMSAEEIQAVLDAAA